MPVDSQYKVVPTGVGNTVVSAAPGTRLGKIEVVTTGTGTVQLFDNATTNSGNILASVPGSAVVGYEIVIDVEVTNGIVAAGSASSPVCIVTFST